MAIALTLVCALISFLYYCNCPVGLDILNGEGRSSIYSIVYVYSSPISFSGKGAKWVHLGVHPGQAIIAGDPFGRDIPQVPIVIMCY